MSAVSASTSGRPALYLRSHDPTLAVQLTHALGRELVHIDQSQRLRSADGDAIPVVLLDARGRAQCVPELLAELRRSGEDDAVIVVLRDAHEHPTAPALPSAAVVATVEVPWDDDVLREALRHAERVASRRSRRVLRAAVTATATVLVLEDDSECAEAVATYLLNCTERYRVVFARDLAAAVVLLSSERIDVILSDLWLPDAQGLDVVRTLREQAAEVALIVLSGLRDEALALEALQIGAQDYLVKGTVDAQALERAIRFACERERNVEQLVREARFDSLTQVLNRGSFRARVRQAIARARRQQRSLALLYFDLDGFKQINDRHGHAAGDELLREVAARLRDAVREQDTVARLGGDEFAVLLEDLDDQLAAEDVAQRARACVCLPIAIGDLSVCLDTSVGLARYPQDGASADDLIGAADDAMYAIKHGRAAGSALPRTTPPPLRERGIEDRLRAAVRSRELEAYFQPQVELRTRAKVGAEALLRCEIPGRRVLSAGEILPFLARSRLILDAGAQMLEQACRFAADHGELRRIAVNVCLTELESDGYEAQVEAALRACGLPPERLELELSSPSALLRHGKALAALRRLSALGVHIALDDVGADDALRALCELPISTLKLDPALVRAAPEQPCARAVVQAITSLAHTLSLRVVAEGVEREPEAQCMLELGCDAAQGWLFGAALPARHRRSG